MHSYGIRCRHCPKCGAIIGIWPQNDICDLLDWNNNAPCAKTHKYPDETIIKKWLGLILMHKVTYEDGSWENWRGYGGRSRGFVFWCFRFYMKLKGEKMIDRWNRYHLQYHCGQFSDKGGRQ